MKIVIEGLSAQGLTKYPNIGDLNILDLEEDFIEDRLTIFASPTPEARDRFFIWCDKRDLMAIAEDEPKVEEGKGDE